MESIKTLSESLTLYDKARLVSDRQILTVPTYQVVPPDHP